MPIIQTGSLGVNWSSITSGIKSVTNALKGLGSYAKTGASVSPTARLNEMLNVIRNIKEQMQGMKSPYTLKQPFSPFAGANLSPKNFTPTDVKRMMGGIPQLEKMSKMPVSQVQWSKFATTLAGLRIGMEKNKVFMEQIYPRLVAYRDSIGQNVSVNTKYYSTMGALTNNLKKARQASAKLAMQQLPLIGNIMSSFQSAGSLGATPGAGQGMLGRLLGLMSRRGAPGAGKAAGMFGFEKTGAMLKNMTGILGTKFLPMLAKGALAAGKIGIVFAAVAGSIKKVVDFAMKLGGAMWKASTAVAKFGFSLMKLPLTIFQRIHGAIQSVMFSVILLANIWRRVFAEPVATLREVQTATVLAGNSIKDYGDALNKVSNLSLQFAIQIKEIATGYKEVVKSGFDATEATIILGAATKYAGVFQADMATAIDQTIGVLRAFAIPVTEATRVVNGLYAAVTNSRLSLGDLTTALGYCSQAAADAGVTFEETIALLSMLRDSNIRASRAGMAVRAMFANIQRAQGVAAGYTMSFEEAVKSLNINWKLLGDETLDVNAAFREFNKVIADGVTLQERTALRQIFGLRYQAIITELVKKGTSAFEARLAVIKKSADLEKKSQEIAESLSGTIARLSNLYVVFRLEILQKLNTDLTSLNDVWENATDNVREFGKNLGEVLRISAVKPFIDFIKDGLSPEGIKSFSESIMGAATEAGKFIGLIVKETQTWLKAISGKEASSGLKAIVSVIGTVLVYSIRISRVMTLTFMSFVSDWLPSIMSLINKVSTFLGTKFPAIWRQALKMILKLSDWIVAFAIPLASMLMDIVEGFYPILVVLLGPLWLIAKIIQGIVGGVKWLYNHSLGYIFGKWGESTNQVTNFAEDITASLKKASDDNVKNWKDGFTQIEKDASGRIDNLKDKFMSVTDSDRNNSLKYGVNVESPIDPYSMSSHAIDAFNASLEETSSVVVNANDSLAKFSANINRVNDDARSAAQSYADAGGVA